MKEDSLIEITDELLAEDTEIIEELMEEEIQPIIDYKKELERKIFDKAYKEVLELEGEA